MRALCSTVAFLMATLELCAPASAHVPLYAPRVSLSLALDWNNVVLARALAQPTAEATAATIVRRHRIPKLSVTSGATTPLPQALDVAAYDRVERLARAILSPRYDSPDAEHRRLFRSVYLTPYAPYLGCYGFNLSVETDALLR